MSSIGTKKLAIGNWQLTIRSLITCASDNRRFASSLTAILFSKVNTNLKG